ncbi:hypothetical protein SESBI_32411 [Sesbania bispinosa]|nr:hypothetical protein SESBI_32411 [Sesbania bispinosa]
MASSSTFAVSILAKISHYSKGVDGSLMDLDLKQVEGGEKEKSKKKRKKYRKTKKKSTPINFSANLAKT